MLMSSRRRAGVTQSVGADLIIYYPPTEEPEPSEQCCVLRERFFRIPNKSNY